MHRVSVSLLSAGRLYRLKNGFATAVQITSTKSSYRNINSTIPYSTSAERSSFVPYGQPKTSDDNSNLSKDALPSTTTNVATSNELKSLEAIKQRTDKFIPVTRRVLLRKLMEEEGFLSREEQRLMENLAAGLDAYYSHRFYGILEETKLLYDIMDPDKDTYQTREHTRTEILDREYHLLEKIEKLLDKANYFEIPRHQLVALLHDQDLHGIRVSVNPSDYELLRIWTRGKATPKKSTYMRLKSFAGSFLTPRVSSKNDEVYTRVFVAVRSRGEKKVHLKVFKDIMTDKLEFLLPKGKITMSKFDMRFLASSVFVGTAVIAMKSLPVLSDWKVQWSWMGIGLAGLVAARAWIGYKNKRNHYLASLATALYYKTVANNRGVLTLLTDRAQDEEFKEALLAYVFLLSPVNRRGVPGTTHTDHPPVYDTPETLRIRIEDWLMNRFGLGRNGEFRFDIEDALNKLDSLGILVRRRNETLTVLGVKEVLEILPEPSFRWQAVGALRDSESSDELRSIEDNRQEDVQTGWR